MMQTQKVSPVFETNVDINITIVADQEAFFADAATPTHAPHRWIQAQLLRPRVGTISTSTPIRAARGATTITRPRTVIAAFIGLTAPMRTAAIRTSTRAARGAITITQLTTTIAVLIDLTARTSAACADPIRRPRSTSCLRLAVRMPAACRSRGRSVAGVRAVSARPMLRRVPSGRSSPVAVTRAPCAPMAPSSAGVGTSRVNRNLPTVRLPQCPQALRTPAASESMARSHAGATTTEASRTRRPDDSQPLRLSGTQRAA